MSLETIPVPAAPINADNKPVITEQLKPTTDKPASETPAAAEVKVEPPKDRDSARFAALAKREKSLREIDQKIKSERAQLESERQALKDRQSKYEEEDRLWEREPLKALEGKKLSYQKLTELVLNGEKPTPEMLAELKAQEVVERYKKEQQDLRTKELEDLKKSQETAKLEAVNSFKSELKDFYTENSAKYELVALYDAVEYVYAVIDQHYQNTQKVLSKDEACELTEKYFDGLVEKTLQTTKYKAKVIQEPKPDDKPKETSQAKTLTNKMTAAATPQSSLTRDERIKKAMAIGR